jgi:putative NADH-flavin reductase
MKRMFILGATGRTGVEIIDLALGRGHNVTAFVRSPAKITRRDRRLTVVKGDPRNIEELSAALPGHEVVLSALGPSPREAITTHSTLLQECAASALAALARTGVGRFVVVSSALLFPMGGVLPAFFRALIRNHLRDLTAMEGLVESSAVDWTIARPPRLVHGGDGAYRAQTGALPPGSTLNAVLSWRGVAAFMLDAAESGRHRREVVGICR